MRNQMRKIALTGLAVLSIMLGAVIPAQAATGPLGRLSAAAAAPSALADPGAPAPVAPSSISGSRVSCASATSCLSVSEDINRAGGSAPAADYWNGAAWTPLAVPLPRGAAGAGGVIGVSCKPGACLAVGGYSTAAGDTFPLAWTWNGKTLTPAAAPPMPAGTTGASVGDVSCVTASSCVMIGSAFTSGTSSAAPRLIVVIDRWESGKWTMRTVGLTAGQFAEFDGLSCVSVSNCVASAMGISSSFGLAPLLASWNGSALRLFNAPVPRGVTSALLTDVSCVSTVSCVATGVSLSLSTGASSGFTDVLTGKTWAASPIAWPKGSASSLLMAVSCASSKSCVAVGVDGVSNAGTANSGHAAAVSYNGKAWTVQNNVPLPARGTVSEFGGVSCVTATRCVTSGLLGQVNGYAMAPLNGVWNGSSWKLARLS
jgi:hypothetical protein